MERMAMESMVVWYDGQAASESALEWVADRARLHPVRVDLVGASGMFGSGRASVDRQLEDAQRRLRDRLPGLPVETHAFEGVGTGSLLHAALEGDVVVLGVEHHGALRAALDRGMPPRLAQQARTAVYFVPAGWTPSDGPVVIAVDEDSCDRGFELAAREAAQRHVHVRIVHVWRGDERTGSAARARHDRHERILQDAADRVRDLHPGVPVDTDLVRHDDPATALAHLTADSCLLVMCTHRRGVFAGGLRGSVTAAALRAVHAPVCVVGATADRHRAPLGGAASGAVLVG